MGLASLGTQKDLSVAVVVVPDSKVSLICGQVNEPSGAVASRLPKGGVRCH